MHLFAFAMTGASLPDRPSLRTRTKESHTTLVERLTTLPKVRQSPWIRSDPLTDCSMINMIAVDVGQSSANLASAGGDVVMSSMGSVHGINAATGAGQGLAGQK